ncbi:unnamed protein product [Heligmosomoides polygyrus]|uniref:Cadherin domain protein n=1 Tax=Heligmosomoides polygyrus TaxID=6339 RepID=A0A183FDC4_HELPZ|nr:unnamed protein product [Heligmosomoides polygyrus]
MKHALLKVNGRKGKRSRSGIHLGLEQPSVNAQTSTAPLVGTIRTSRVLDREEQSTYWLTIEANDSPQTGVLHVFVRVLDRNDHRPVPLLPIYYANVKENSPQNVVVVKIDATDGDDIHSNSPPSLHYKIEKGDPQSFFRIDQHTGYITTSGSRRLDRETQREHELWVAVCDSGEPQLCSSVPVVVTVDDVNDNAPTFTQPIFHHNVNAECRCCRVFASDVDVGKNAELFYNITDGDPKFSIDENDNAFSVQVASITVQATDRGLPAQMTQTRAILTAVATPQRPKGTVNRAPQFAKGTSRKIPVSDADQVGFTIGKLEAVDPDGDTIWWSIIDGNVNDTFSLKPDSGLLQLAKPVESLPVNTTSAILTIRISDGQLNDTTEVTVELSLSPTTRPIFSAQHYKTQISEKTAIGTQIYTVRAKSNDLSRTSKPLVYGVHSVEDTGMEDKLRVEPTTGSVLVMEALDYEVCHEIRAIIYARQGTLTNYVTLTVTVTDDNDNAPRFVHKDYAKYGWSEVCRLVGHLNVELYLFLGNELGYFALDPVLGVITVAKDLPEAHTETILTVRATDNGRYPLSDTANVRIQTVAGDEALYQRTVRDSTPLGSVLMVVSTRPNGDARYSLKHPCPYFEVHPASGAVSLTRWLTRERAKSVACTVVARNRAGLEDTAKVALLHVRKTKHQPAFAHLQRVHSREQSERNPFEGSSVLLENNSPLLVSATDKDIGPSALIGYRLLNPNEPYFVVDFVTGAIRSRKPLDYEKMKEWIFYVQASDMGEPVRSSPIPAMVTVKVLDTNDQKPVFTKTKYEAELILPTLPGVVVARPTAIDEDTVGKLRYTIKYSNLFSINSTDGSVILIRSDAKALNGTKYMLEVLASDGAHTASSSVEISVQNTTAESNGFRFPQTEYHANVKENTTYPSGEPLLAVTPEGASVTYRILNEREEVFIHDGTGMISLTGKRFDREEEPIVRLLVQARTHEIKPQLAQTVVAIRIDDVNDCAPMFVGLPYDVVVSSDSAVGEKILSVKAVDRDIGMNGIVRYHSASLPPAFKLNKHDGKITVHGKLDEAKVYRFEVIATDQGGLFRVQEVRVDVVEKARPIFTKKQYQAAVSEAAPRKTIVGHYLPLILEYQDINTLMIDSGGQGESVTGVNDNGPRFEHLVYRVNVSESTPVDTKLLAVKAVDPDGGNGLMSYAVTQLLDFEKRQRYEVTLVAADDSQLSGESKLVVTVEDVNDEPPRFSTPIAAATVSDTAMAGQFVAIMSVTDDDTVSSIQGGHRLLYSIIEGDETLFSVAEHSGEVSLLRSIDADDAMNDGGKKVLNVSVSDGLFTAYGQLTVSVAVSGPRDGVPPLHYSIGNGDSRQRPLRIEKLTGRIHPKIVFNYHHQNIYKVPLVVEDALGRKAFSTLTVNVVDENDSTPVFVSAKYATSASAAVREGEALLMVSATDEDVDDAVEYTLIGDDATTSSFRLHPRHGTLSIVKPLESLVGSTVNLVVRATDQANPPHHATAQVSISVLPEEIPIPKFSNSHYLFVVAEDAAVGTVIGKLQQTEEVAEVRFSALDTPDDFPFTVERASGKLIVRQQLDREKREVWRFVARADAAGGAHSMTTVTVRLSDVNDHAPMFLGAYDRLSISEDAPVGTSVAVFSATDMDRSPGGNIAFSLVERENAFKVDAESGWLVVASPLDRELQPLHELTVRATDEGGLYTDHKFKVEVRSFPTEVVSPVKARRLISVDRLTALLIFQDSDLPPFNNTRLFISRGNDDGLFAIDDSGKISIARLNQMRRSYNLTLLAFDGAHATTATMNVSSSSVPCNVYPSYPSPSDHSELGRRVAVRINFRKPLHFLYPCSGSSLAVVAILNLFSVGPTPLTLHIAASNFMFQDSGAYGRVQYSLASDHGMFVIDSETGAITVTRPLDREQTHEYLLHVLAKDSDPVKPKTLVLVSVLDQNDNPPLFERSEYVLQVMESESVGYTLVTVRADGGDAGETVVYIPLPSCHSAGVLKLAKGLDYEKEKLLSLTIIATDSGSPPLSSDTVVTIQVLDENDNVPVFVKESYKAAVDENSANGTKILKVIALFYCKSSFRAVERLCKVKGDEVALFLHAILISTNPYHRFEVEARDGGEPAQKAVVTVLIDVNDVNDNSPVFADCNMTAVVQEGVMPGHSLLSLSITDADGPEFGSPFRVEVRGEGAKAFRVDEHYNLVTVTRFDHAKRDRFLLTLIAYDRGNRSTDCPLTVFVKEESRHPPRISPLRISLNTLMGEFKGGVIGTVEARDDDAGDMLRFSIVDGSIRGPLPTDAHPRPHLFRVDAKTGEVWSEHGIAGGLHAFNVSVTDGKYSTVSYVEVEVTSLEQDAVDHAVAVRVKGMTALEFFTKHAATFRAIFAQHLNVDARNIQLLSVQETPRTRSPRSSVPSSDSTDVDILFTVSRGGGRGMLKPDHVYTRLKHDFQSIVDQSGKMKYQLTTEMCTPGVCQRGECRERVYLDDQQQTVVSVGGVAFVAPHHNRLAECICPEGLGSKRFSQPTVEVNACARSPCHPWEMCVPSEGSRFECVCPPGSSGDRCSQASCTNEGRCLEEAELSVGGTGYFEMSIAHEMETRMELEVELKTTTLHGVILHAHGPTDYHMLELVDGRVVYRWEAGSGEGSVATETSIADAQWHRISVSRRGRRTRLLLDGADTKEGWSPAGSDVINLYSVSHRLYFGARVTRDNSSSVSISNAIVACFRAISIDRRSVAKTRQGLRLYSASTGCRAMAATPCSEAPCRNGGACHISTDSFVFRCTCPARYTGANCEIDSDPCGSRPCPLGIQCIPFYNEYLCKCPNGFTGKRCEIRGYVYQSNEFCILPPDVDDACAAEPCGLHGTCIPIPRQHTHNLGYICNCTHGFSGKTCDGKSSHVAPTFLARISLMELIIALGILVLIIAVIFAIVIVCRCLREKSEDGKYGEHVHAVAHVRNPHVVPPPVASAPPPLPPRAFRGGNQMISNLEQAQLTGLPTVQVRCCLLKSFSSLLMIICLGSTTSTA